MITVNITVDWAAYTQAQADILLAPMRFAAEFKRRLTAIQPKILAEIRNAPSAPKYPIEWQSERQRRAFFASDGFGHGIPYKRTGKLQQSWMMTQRASGNGATVNLENSDPKAVYVQADLVQRMHLASGWPQVDNIVARNEVLLADMVVQTWDDIVSAI